ncbi:MAG TPA: hypothetical protein VEP90_08205, partial [Methylomirabilota bacterium]|nr:hypothetical protein [Methylomirabilota bacterium]
NSYRAIDDLRMRVFGFLPLVSGVGIFFLLNNSVIGTSSRGQPTSFAQFLLPIGLIGAIVTLGLFFYDIRAIQLRSSLVKTGKKIEHSLGIGQFTTRPQDRFGIIGDTRGSTLIYTVVIAGWVFSALISISPLAAWIAAVILFLIGVIVVIFSGKILYHDEVQQPKLPENRSGKATIPVG